MCKYGHHVNVGCTIGNSMTCCMFVDAFEPLTLRLSFVYPSTMRQLTIFGGKRVAIHPPYLVTNRINLDNGS